VAISIVGGATGTTSATLPTHQADDIIIGFAFRDGSTVQPTLPAGWNQLRDQAGTTCCSRTAWRRATGAGTTTGTWTNASRVAFIVLRGAWREFPIGSDAAGAGTAASVTYPALTVRKTDSTSMAVRFAGHRSIDTNLQTAPTNYTNPAGPRQRDRRELHHGSQQRRQHGQRPPSDRMVCQRHTLHHGSWDRGRVPVYGVSLAIHERYGRDRLPGCLLLRRHNRGGDVRGRHCLDYAERQRYVSPRL
jgi:hypothetical protein